MASIVLVGMVAAVVVLSRWRETFAIGLVIGLPIFFNWDGSGLDYGHSVIVPDPGATLPLSTFAAPFLLPAVWRGVRQPLSRDPWLRRLDLGVVAIAIWIVVAAIAGYASGRHPEPEIVAQTASPLWFYAIGRGWREREQVADAVRGFLIGATATATFILFSNWVAYEEPPLSKEGVQLTDLVIGPFDVYQIWDYVPMLYAVAAVFAFALAVCRVAVVWSGLSALLLTVAVMLMHSRGALMALIAGVFLVLVALVRRARPVALATGAVVFAALFIGLGAAGVAAPNRVIATALPDRFVLSKDVTSESVAQPAVPAAPAPAPEPDARKKKKQGGKRGRKPAPKPQPKPKTLLDVSNEERIQRAEEAIDVVKGNPVFGSRFAGSIEDDSGVSRTTLAHNQYLDYANRAGIPLTLLFVFVAAIAMWMWALGARRSVAAVAGAGVLAALLVVGNLTQVNFVQPLTAYSLWILLGASHLAARVGGRSTPA